MKRNKKIKRGADISDCKKYRYVLWREWDMLSAYDGYICWVMLNPSKANCQRDDNTVTRVMNLSCRFNYRKCAVLNLIPYYATNHECLKKLSCECVMGDEDRYNKKMREALRDADKVVCAWGDARGLKRRLVNPAIQNLRGYLEELGLTCKTYCLTTTKYGHPHHPSRLEYNRKLEKYHV